MKRTNYLILCSESCKLEPIYRTAFFDGVHYWIKWQGKLINVDADINNKNYIKRNWWED